MEPMSKPHPTGGWTQLDGSAAKTKMLTLCVGLKTRSLRHNIPSVQNTIWNYLAHPWGGAGSRPRGPALAHGTLPLSRQPQGMRGRWQGAAPSRGRRGLSKAIRGAWSARPGSPASGRRSPYLRVLSSKAGNRTGRCRAGGAKVPAPGERGRPRYFAVVSPLCLVHPDRPVRARQVAGAEGRGRVAGGGLWRQVGRPPTCRSGFSPGAGGGGERPARDQATRVRGV